MPGITDNSEPSYISSHSADVILSDIRPIKLKIEALRSINFLLDEFLYNILSTARSLSTDKLRASLLSLLPTTLGKEALLEAEVELRAYWDRTGPADVTVLPLEDDSKTFHLQWAFELLRLKCEAYSTLNESDEDAKAESRINERLGSADGTQPKASLIAPAGLYLTAILEAMCEHILSNVGRVTARDSSRTSATVQDLFVALCEDHLIYDLFKTMKVYEQIEQLSKAPPKPRRSKSFTRNDKYSRTSSPQQDAPTSKGAQSRSSSEAPGLTMAAGPPTLFSNPSSRSSLEKTRAIKMFMANSRSSNDRDADSQNGHKKTDSVHSENSKLIPHEQEPPAFEDEAMQQEFDDLMRSTSTMRMSLTPDRLKTMEVYKQEKDQRGNRRLVPLSLKSDSDSSVLPPRGTGRRPSLLRVDSIREDDDEEPTTKSPVATRSRQASVSNPPKSKIATTSRIRSVSTSGAAPRLFTKLSRTTTPIPSPVPPIPPGSPVMQNQHHRVNQGNDSFPPRTRKIQQNRESMDLDDVMGGSDAEEYVPATPAKQLKPKPTTTPNRSTHYPVSAGTRDLMDFLAQGPPDVMDFSPEGHSGYTTVVESGKPKSSGRLQRMISKLSLGNAEKSRGGSEDPSRSRSSPQTPIRPQIPSKPSASNLSSLANRPIPPRPPRPISPPSSPSRDSSDDQNYNDPRQPIQSSVQEPVKPVGPTSPESPVSPQREQYNGSVSSNHRSPINVHNTNRKIDEHSNNTPARTAHTVVNGETPSRSFTELPTSAPSTTHTRRSSTISHARKPAPVYVPTSSEPHLSVADAQDMHRLFSRATSADECRIIYDMFLAKSGILIHPADYDVPYPSPSLSVGAPAQTTPTDSTLEHSLVEMLLTGEPFPEPNIRKRQTKRPRPEGELVGPSSHGPHGDRKTPNGGHRVRNGDSHGDHRSGLSDGKEVNTSTPILLYAT